MGYDKRRAHQATLVDRARAMRHEPAPAEQKLWQLLRGRQLDGLKFRRQHPLPPYIADFYCHELGLVIELDGDSHFDPNAQTYDERRTRRLERSGHRVIRFVNGDVYRFTDAVLEEIWRECERLRQPSGAALSDSPSP